ncbi:hypothetical protein PLESTB_001503800 [Pleodorina starrii]|uniref:Uncharacterized protein n=1 Tax=Pleodorina starrii TaxID=330485 RepID=A0A9W6F7R4_9CHLO|nr:hypothetical protein PLESTM_000661900 [Pleodorina starrii]GLC59592.1 hypothetical protein PLESTB_001503800 [Pleodorina starrii]GLC67830.1 hypothetical protein PLESTF_000611900 [Pleodorina starrii]
MQKGYRLAPEPLHRPCVAHNLQSHRCAVRAAAARDRPYYNNSPQHSSGFLLSKEANKELLASKTVAELKVAFESNADYHDNISIATTWVRLGRLVRSGNRRQGQAFARDIMGKTLSYISNKMDVRQLANVVWGVGQLGLDLGEEKLGPYLVHQLEERAQELFSRTSTADPDISQLCFGVSIQPRAWSQDFLERLVEWTVQSLDGEDCRLVCDACKGIAKLAINRGIRLNEQQRGRLASMVESVVDPDGDEYMAESVPGLLFGAATLQLPLAPETVRQLHDLAVSMPLPLARRKGGINVAGCLFRCTQLGYQPDSTQVQLWAQRLLDDALGPGKGSREDAFGWTVHALSTCRNYVPPPELKQRLAAEADKLARRKDVAKPSQQTRLAVAARNWKVRLPTPPGGWPATQV